MRKLDLTGMRFGRLVALYQGPHQGKYITWICQCDCGNLKQAVGPRLRFGAIQSCGCLEKESRGQSQKTHGEGYDATKEYRAWCKAKGRCFNPNDRKYPLYGGRGITMCDRWKNSYINFLSDMGRAPEGSSIDRINNNGNYEPGNCQWATAKQQTRNQSRNIIVRTPEGIEMTFAEFLEKSGIPYDRGYRTYIRRKRK